jgi:hypothetical protein
MCTVSNEIHHLREEFDIYRYLLSIVEKIHFKRHHCVF